MFVETQNDSLRNSFLFFFKSADYTVKYVKPKFIKSHQKLDFCFLFSLIQKTTSIAQGDEPAVHARGVQCSQSAASCHCHLSRVSPEAEFMNVQFR